LIGDGDVRVRQGARGGDRWGKFAANSGDYVRHKRLFNRQDAKIAKKESNHCTQGASMDLKTLETAMHAFVASKGWYEPESKRPQTPRNLAISLVLEAGEVLELYQWREEGVDQGELAGELADVALYLIQLASITGIDLGEAVMRKLDVNYGRTWDAETGE